MDVCCESLEAAGASMRPSGSSPAARPPLRHRRRPAHAGEGPSLARPTPSLASPPLAGEAHALASEGPSPARVKALAGEAPRQRGPSPRWRGCPRQRGPRPRQRERVRFLMPRPWFQKVPLSRSGPHDSDDTLGGGSDTDSVHLFKVLPSLQLCPCFLLSVSPLKIDTPIRLMTSDVTRYSRRHTDQTANEV